MSFVRPSFSQAFLNRRSICSTVSLPRDFTLIMCRSSFRARALGRVVTGRLSVPNLNRRNPPEVGSPVVYRERRDHQGGRTPGSRPFPVDTLAPGVTMSLGVRGIGASAYRTPERLTSVDHSFDVKPPRLASPAATPRFGGGGRRAVTV